MKIHNLMSKLQELNTYLEEFLPDVPGQKTTPLPIDEIIDIVYRSMPTMWKRS